MKDRGGGRIFDPEKLGRYEGVKLPPDDPGDYGDGNGRRPDDRGPNHAVYIAAALLAGIACVLVVLLLTLH